MPYKERYAFNFVAVALNILAAAYQRAIGLPTRATMLRWSRINQVFAGRIRFHGGTARFSRAAARICRQPRCQPERCRRPQARGVELEGHASPGNDVDLVAACTYLDNASPGATPRAAFIAPCAAAGRRGRARFAAGWNIAAGLANVPIVSVVLAPTIVIASPYNFL
jgi:hypothetical protein